MWREASHVRGTVEAADQASAVGETVALRSTFAPLERPVEILLGRVDTVAGPAGPMLRNTGAVIPETMPAFVRFAATETTRAPQTYVVTFGPWQEAVRDLLDAHGVRYTLGVTWGTAREGFRVDSVAVSARLSQGVQMQEAFGQWVGVPAETAQPPRLAAALLVPVDQPLGRLAVALLDPRSDDGVVAWGIVPAEALAPGDLAPIQRIP